MGKLRCPQRKEWLSKNMSRIRLRFFNLTPIRLLIYSSQEMKPLMSTFRLISEKIMKRWRNSKREKGEGK
jgi:hypothetical protein